MKTQMNFRVDQILADRVRQYAEDEHRTVTQVVELALMEYFVAHGVDLDGLPLPSYLAPQKPKPQKPRKPKQR